MNLTQVYASLTELAEQMDASIDDVDKTSEQVQGAIYLLLRRRLAQFSTDASGNLDPTQPVTQRMAKITREMEALIEKNYLPSIREHLGMYSSVDKRVIALQRGYNEVELSLNDLTPARKSVYDQAAYYLQDGLADAYVLPAKYLLMQAVTSGINIKDAQRVLKHWNDGTMATGGTLSSNRPTPRLQTYATQIARDSIYTYNGTINEIIRDRFGLKEFIYVGGLVEDSRPFCRHLVSLRRKIKLEEVPPLLEKYPQGIIAGTTMKNFVIRRGGYNCQHLVMMVRSS